jgi:NAD(P)-dependent dehydrogenase (short-subunit alcohol dehydrogenase family)
MTAPLLGQVAIVTGAAHGLGREHAEVLAAHGATVVLADVDADGARAAADRISGARAAELDVTDEDAVQELVDDVARTHGRIDVLVNNAGGSRGYVDEESSPTQRFRAVLELNLVSSWLLAITVAPVMAAGGGGRIVNTTSNTVFRHTADVAVSYIAAKAGVVGLTRALARELGPRNVTVNAVAPGFTPHDDLRRKLPDDLFAVMSETTLAQQCLPRLGTPADIAGAVLLLVGPGGAFITGQVLVVDGGWTFA